MRFATLSVAVALAGAAALKATGADVLATGEVNHAGIKAEVTECKRSEGMLTLKIRLTNTTDRSQAFYLVKNRKDEEHYVTAKKKKYLVLRDAERKPLASPATDAMGNVRVNIKKGDSFTWWAKFPSPPAEVKKVEYTWPVGSPIDDIPCTDARPQEET